MTPWEWKTETISIPKHVITISYEDRTVCVDLTKIVAIDISDPEFHSKFLLAKFYLQTGQTVEIFIKREDKEKLMKWFQGETNEE